MDEALDQVADGFVPRGLAPHWYLPTYLPTGLASGFVGVTMGYLLTHHGVSVAAVAAMVALFGLPLTWKFAMGPVLDTSLSPTKWYVITLSLAVAALIALAFIPRHNAQDMPLAERSLLAAGCRSQRASSSSATAGMALTTPNARRGAVAGWQQCGQLGGTGLGGGLGLWLWGWSTPAARSPRLWCSPDFAPFAPYRSSSCVCRRASSAFLCAIACATFWARCGSWARTRTGVLAILANVLPAFLGGRGRSVRHSNVAGDWHASADVVALVLGVVTGVSTLPGCVIGGYLCDIFPRRSVYIASALACALGEAAMALGPHTPAWFAIFSVVNAMLLGLSWAAVSAVCFEQLGARAAATVAAVLSSISNLPVVVMVALVGSVQAKHGSTGMLLTEAAFGGASVIVYVLIATPSGVAAPRTGLEPAMALVV